MEKSLFCVSRSEILSIRFTWVLKQIDHFLKLTWIYFSLRRGEWLGKLISHQSPCRLDAQQEKTFEKPNLCLESCSRRRNELNWFKKLNEWLQSHLKKNEIQYLSQLPVSLPSINDENGIGNVNWWQREEISVGDFESIKGLYEAE